MAKNNSTIDFMSCIRALRVVKVRDEKSANKMHKKRHSRTVAPALLISIIGSNGLVQVALDRHVVETYA